ncbi:A-kinase anchor protein 13-like isoform X2 [Myxocyprinus asiaticus]|uniref:A-kinase anchor protein 13-like isoform X2 n=1 Tax=Myxocyprinus asiaticus TaxID=70543 RepID=UPI002223ABE6|nr:A-kinase anchor protein 13-like isoform X2 [Myxocyprinus asiaticus]
MKLSPCQAPLYGLCVLTVQLCDEVLVEGEQGEVEFFLLFTGSTQSHLTSTLKVNHATLQAVCPAHNCCESVLVTLCSAGKDGFIQSLSSKHLCFVQDLAFDMAQFLVGAVGQMDMLEEALLLDEHQIPLQECERLDQSLSLALRHLTLPPGWSLLGKNTGLEPQETLLHFTARRGLFKVASFLLKQPGGREALNLCNKQGATPPVIAQSRGHTALLDLFSQEESDTESGVETLRRISSGTRVVQHHPSLNTYTLSVATEPGSAPPILQADILELRKLIICHRQGKGGAVFQQSSESLHTSQECVDSLETRDCCFEEARHNSLDTREQGFTPFSTEENKGECNDWLDPSQNREGDGGPSFSCETLASLPHNGNSEDQRACACENSESDCREREESSDAGLVSTGDVGDNSDALQSSCGQEREETDKADGIICEALGHAEGPEGENQEEGQSSVEEKPAEEKELSEGSHTAEAGDMGITQSLYTPESSDVESCSEGAKTDDEEVQEDGSRDRSEPEKVKDRNKEPSDLHPTLEDPFIGNTIQYGNEISLMIQEHNVETALDCLEQNSFESEVHACQDSHDETGNFCEPGTHVVEESKEGICDDILCNVEGSQGHLDSSRSFDQDDVTSGALESKQLEDCANEEPHDLTEKSHSETDDCQRMDDTRRKLSYSILRNSDAKYDSSLFHDVDQEQEFMGDTMVDGSENEGQVSIDILQSEPGSEPESHTPTSEDTLEPEDLELCSSEAVLLSSDCEQKLEDLQENQENKLSSEAQATLEEVLESAMAVDMENSTLPHEQDCSENLWQDMTSNNEVMQVASDHLDHSDRDVGGVFVHTVKSGDQGILVDLLDILVKSKDTGIPKENPAVNAEDLLSSLVHSDYVGRALHIADALDQEDSTVSPQEGKQVQGSLDPVTQESDAEVHAVAQPMGEEDLLKDAPLEDHMDFQKTTWPDVDMHKDAPMVHRDKDTLCSSVSHKRHSLASTESSQCSEFCTCNSEAVTFRDSGSDTDGFLSPDTGEDNSYRKGQEAVGGGDSTSEVSVSCSSTDDTASLGHPSSSAESSEEVRQGGEAEEEAKDRLTEVPLHTSLLRSTVRSLSPLRRHSWGPGKNQGGEGEMNQRNFSSHLSIFSSVRSTGEEKPVFYRRSLSWCPCEPHLCRDLEEIRELISYSLEGLAAEVEDGKHWVTQSGGPSKDHRGVQRQESEERGSLMSLTEEGPESDLGECSSPGGQKTRMYHPLRQSCPSVTLPLTKSVSMLSISQRDIDSMRSFTSTTSSMGYSITEEEPGPLREDFEKGCTKVSRTFSYLKSKMYKKTREKDKEKSREKEREAKERDKKSVNGHQFSPSSSLHPALCQQCNKTLNTKDAVNCTNCNVRVHKSCRESIPICPKGKIKFHQQQFAIPESTTMPVVTLRTKSSTLRERPWSAILSPDDYSLIIPSRRPASIMPFHSSNLSKSMSINNIAMFDDMPLKGLRHLSQSTDSLHKPNKVTESTESLDEGTEIIDSRLMGEFEADVKELEADSWSLTVDKKCLKQLKKDVIKRQDVIYELIQTEMHHLRTLRIMSDVYSKGLQTDLQLELQMVEKMFPMLEELLELHTFFFSALLERKKEARLEGTDGGFIINRIGDVLVSQFSDSNAESMKKIYGKFCSRHNESVNFYKELHARDKHFQAFIRKKMSSSVVRRLGIPECILLVTQRITKYPVLLQRILQHTKENEGDYENLTQALQLVKDIIASVDNKVNEHEKKRRLKDIYGRMDSKSITRMKSGQMFAREDLLRSRKLLHDGPLQMKNTAGRLKDVHALLLSDVFIFLQEKDQKYVFASLDQRATVISLQKLIVREVAHEERGLFLITAGIEKPEMVEVHASSREERNTWMQFIQDAMHSIGKDDDEGIPSETEEDKKLLETKTKEMRDMLQRKDEQIVSLLLEKMKLFREMCGSPDDPVKMLFRANNEELPKGEPIMMDALKEVEMLQALVNGSLGGAVGQQVACAQGTVCLPRRAETFGGFDSHQMNISKHGDKDEVEDLRRTESDSVLKKGGNANLLLLLKRNSEVLSSVTHLHELLSSLQAVVLQQDTFIEDQRQGLNERTPSRTPSRPSSRPPSLVEQEKQRSLERHRQEAAALQRQQATHAEERRRREKEWEVRERELMDREVLLHVKEEEVQRRYKELDEVQQELQGRKEDYQKDLERLRDAQRRLDREREQMQREVERVEHLREVEARFQRTPSSTSEDSLKLHSSSSVEKEIWEGELSSSPRKNSSSKHKGRSLFSLGGKTQSLEGQNQIPTRLLQLATTKEKKDKKKKKSKTQQPSQETASHLLPLTEPPMDGEIFFC